MCAILSKHYNATITTARIRISRFLRILKLLLLPWSPLCVVNSLSDDPLSSFSEKRSIPISINVILLFFSTSHTCVIIINLCYDPMAATSDNKSVRVPWRLIILWNLVTWNRNPLLAYCVRPCLVHPKKQKVFKIHRHIESCGTCMKH